MTINFGNPAVAAAAAGLTHRTGESNVKLKEKILGEIGLKLSDIPNAETLDVEVVRLKAAEIFLEAMGYEAEERSVLINRNKDEDATSMFKAQFEGIVRRANAGFRVFPEELIQAYREGDLVYISHKMKSPAKAYLKAFDGIDKVEADSLMEQVNAGKAILIRNEDLLEDLLRQVEDDRDRRQVREQVYTIERITRDIVMANPMTPAKLAAFIPDAKIDGNVVKATWDYLEVVFDLDKGTINERELLANIISYGLPMTPAMVMGAFALSLDGVTKQSSAEAKVIAAASSLFVEEDYHYDERRDDDRHSPVIRNKVGVLRFEFKKANSFVFGVSDARTTADVVNAGRYFLRQGIPVSFEQQANWVTIGDGARASLVGIALNNEGQFLAVFGTDANKAPKLLSRPKLATGKIGKTIDLATGNTTTTASGLLIRMNDGTLVRAYGTRVDRMALSDFTLAPNSGQAIVSKDFKRTVCVEKTIRAKIDGVWAGFVSKDQDVASQAQALKLAVVRKLEINKAELSHGDAVITFDNVVRASWENHGMNAKVISDPKVKISSVDDSVTVTVKVAAYYTDFAHKFRADGLKTTGTAGTLTLKDAVTGVGIDQYDMLASTEDIKGIHVALLRAWADSIVLDLHKALAEGWVTPEDHAAGGVVYEPNTGLSDAQREAMTKWRDAHAKVVFITVEDMDGFHVSLIKKMVAKAKANPEWAKQKGIDPDAYTFENGKVTQKVHLVEASVVLGIEVSTVRENIVSQPGIGEQTVALEYIEKDLGVGIWNAASGQRRSVYEMMEQALNRTAPNVLDVSGLPLLNHDLALKGRDLLQHYRKQFPKGLTITNGNVSVTVHFGALLALGALLPGGAATGVAQTVLELLNHLHVAKEGGSGWENFLNRLISKVKKASLKWAASKGILGRVTRTGKIFAGRKVKTTYSRKLGYGEIGLHPLDPAVLDGKVKEGDAILLGRSPMISMVAGRVVITEDCPLGCILVKSHLWAWGNEGDGDGDPAAFMVVPEQLAAKVLAAMARSPFGPRGYLIAHGKDFLEHPYAEFFMGNGKPDKNPHGDLAIHTTASFSVEEYADVAENVGQHYSTFLGRTFAITSYLTYLLGKKSETMGEAGRDQDHEVAVVYAWRLLYEGIGLSGYTPKAGSLARAFATLTNQNRVYIPAKVAEMLAKKDVDVQTAKNDNGEDKFYLEGVAAMQWVWEDTVGKSIAYGVAEYMYNAVLTTGCYSKLERSLDQHTSAREILAQVGDGHLVDFTDAALIYGTLRRGSKGLAVAAALNEEDHDGLFQHLTDEHLKIAGNGIVGQMLRAVVKVQKDAKVVKELIEE